MFEVVGDGALLIGQFFEDKAQYIKHGFNHLNLVDVLMLYDVVYYAENVANALVLFFIKAIDGVVTHHVGVNQNTLRLEVG